MSAQMEQVDRLEVEAFLDALRGDPPTIDPETGNFRGGIPPVGELTAALSVGWTPLKLKKLKRDPEFVALMNETRTQFLESIESIVARQAYRGQRWANELILFCHGAHRGWKPPTHRHEVKHSGQVDHSIVASVGEAVSLALQDVPVAALQAAPDIVDAEVVSDSADD